MLKSKWFYSLLLALLLFNSCIEPFSFAINEETKPLVIQSFISDVSYDETISYPSNGRYFQTILRYGQNLSRLGENVSGANVSLLDNTGNKWTYTEVAPGDYQLINPSFRALEGTEYKLEILMPNGDIFESDWEKLVDGTHEMGDIGFIEKTVIDTRWFDDKKILEEVKGIDLTVDIPENKDESDRFLMWQFETVWIYLAGFLNDDNPFYQCWVTGNAYMSQYLTLTDHNGGYTNELLFIEYEWNERVAWELSILVKQFMISEEYYDFLQELDNRWEASQLFATPPFNLKTNYHGVNTENQVFGYFSVRKELAKRFYWSIDDLSYTFTRSPGDFCLGVDVRDFENPCFNCLNYYYGGEASLTPPVWWNP